MLISKIDAAQRQLNFAIRILFDDADPIAVHTLVGVANRLYSDLIQHAQPNRSWDTLAQKANSLGVNDYFSTTRKAQNFFKHADNDVGDALEFDPVETEALALWAVLNASELHKMSVEAEVFQLWYIASHSQMEDMDSSPLREAIKLVGRDLRNTERSKRLRIGRRVLRRELRNPRDLAL